MILAFVITYFVHTFIISCLELYGNNHRNKGEFVTTWSYKDHEKIEELSVPRINRLEKTYLLNTCLFRRTGQIEYQTTQISKMHYVDDQGKLLPYHKKVMSVVNGESVKLHCDAFLITPESLVNVTWAFNGSNINSKMDTPDTKVIYEKDVHTHTFSSDLKISFLDNFGFGDYNCIIRSYYYFGSKMYFNKTKLNAMTNMGISELLIGQHSVRQYVKRDFYVYATPGGAIDLTWKPMNFDNDNEDIIQYYYVNGKHFERKHTGNGTTLSCSSFSYLYIVYA